jgi:hypothetical protein
MTIIKKFDTDIQEEKKVFGFSKKIMLPFGIGLIVLMVMEIWVSHNFVISGAKLQEIENLQSSLTLENQILEDNIASSSALVKVASSAATLGLITPSNIQYIR